MSSGGAPDGAREGELRKARPRGSNASGPRANLRCVTLRARRPFAPAPGRAGRRRRLRTAARRRPSRIGTRWISISSTRPAARYCCAAFAPPASETSLPPAARRACSSADSMPSVTNVKVVPPSIASGARGWCVSTNTGWWYGGLSPHQPFHGFAASQGPGWPPNMLRPMIVAPMLAIDSSTTARALVDLAALQPCVRAPGCQREHPLVQAHAADPERVLDALVGTGDEAVERHRDLEAQPGHQRAPTGVLWSAAMRHTPPSFTKTRSPISR